MNKRIIDEEIQLAYDVLSATKIANNGVINKAFRGQISSFGAAISCGSLISAVAFFSDQGSCSVDRTKLLSAIYDVMKQQKHINPPQQKLFDYVREQISRDVGNNRAYENACKEDILNAAIALKLAMNIYELQ